MKEESGPQFLVFAQKRVICLFGDCKLYKAAKVLTGEKQIVCLDVLRDNDWQNSSAKVKNCFYNYMVGSPFFDKVCPNNVTIAGQKQNDERQRK